MLSIYLCDDIQDHLLQFKNIIQHYLMFKDWDIQIVCATTNPHELLSVLKNQPDIGIYFLVVNLKSNINGFQLAEIIREHDPRGFIVFITTHEECSHITYENGLEALNYILKDNPEIVIKKIEQCLQKAYLRYEAFVSDERLYLIIKTSSTTYFIKFDEILVIRTSVVPHQIEIVKKDGLFSVYGKLKDIDKKLDHRFYRIHNSYIINTNYIESINTRTKKIKMYDGSLIPISNTYFKRFFNFINKEINR